MSQATCRPFEPAPDVFQMHHKQWEMSTESAYRHHSWFPQKHAVTLQTWQWHNQKAPHIWASYKEALQSLQLMKDKLPISDKGGDRSSSAIVRQKKTKKIRSQSPKDSSSRCLWSNFLRTTLVGDQHCAPWERSGVFQLDLKCIELQRLKWPSGQVKQCQANRCNYMAED